MMCGLTALIGPLAGVSVETLAAVQEILRHRGPDGEGIVLFRGGGGEPAVLGHVDTPREARAAGLPYSPRAELAGADLSGTRVVFAHRRLSILDLSPAGHQPMCCADGRLWIVYNGEIYNYVELRAELAAMGHRFVSSSDTEVLLAGYRQWGADLLPRLNGMFALVLLDRASGRLFATRDRFGVKPLYYWISPAGLVALASEIKAFTVLPGWRPGLNAQRAYDFLNWNAYDHTDETLFEGVFQLRGGEALELDLAALEATRPAPGARLPVRSWYSLAPRPFKGTMQDAAGEWLGLFEDAVRLQLRSDVPVGSCLSGGLDSSLLVAVMRRQLGRSADAPAQKSFSAYAGASPQDERPFIDAVVRSTGVEAHGVDPDPNGLFGRLESVTWHQDEPFGSASIFAQWSVFRLAAGNHIKVTLDGQGADELLAGYHSYFGARLAGLLRALRWMEWWRDVSALRLIHGYPLLWALQQSANFLLPEGLRQPLRRIAGKTSTAAPWLDLDRLGASPRDPFLATGAARARSVRDLSRAQIARVSLPMLLHCADRDSMAHSVEARVPYLDHRLVEFSVGLPDEYKIGGGTTKRVMREAATGLLPEMVRARADKIGFATAEETWMRSAMPGAFRNALREAIESSRGIIRHEALDRLEQMIRGGRPFGYDIWRMISFGTWLRVFGVTR